MKKLLRCLMCLGISLFFISGISACGAEISETAVNLIAIDVNSAGLRPDIDYFVVAEPAASTKVKAISGLNFVGDLQSLYGGENGYPQAVVVAKNNLLGTDMLYNFTNALSESYNWLMSDGTSVENIVNAIQSHLTDGLESSIKVQNISKDIVKNCGIKFVPATESRTDLVSFMEKLNSVSESSFGTPSEDFFKDVHGGASYADKISVYAPDGAPALGLAKLMYENVLENVEYNVVSANAIQTFVSGAVPKADICVLPVNLAVKILGNAKNYGLIGTLTHGNLYLLSKHKTQINADNLKNLKGKKVGVVNLAAVPGLTFKLILKSYGIKFIEPYND